MKYNNLLIFLLFSAFAFAQNSEPKGQWIVANNIGMATVEAETYFKSNAFIIEGFLGKEFAITNNLILVSGIEYSKVTANFFDESSNSLFLKNAYVSLPAYIKLISPNETKANLFGSIGAYGSYLFKSRTQDLTNNLEVTENRLGVNLGIQASFGSKFKITEKLSFIVGLKTKTDIVNSNKNSLRRFKLKDVYSIQLGLGFN